MTIPTFLSEFDPADLPFIAKESIPLKNVPLDTAVEALPAEKRIEEAYALVLDAVYGYYFAKELDAKLGQLILSKSGPLSSGLSMIRDAVVKNAVIGIAKTIDETTGRTRSLPHSLGALKRSLEDSSSGSNDDDVEATIQLIEHIVSSTNPDKVKSLLYVRHIRNKWAGHSSWDLSVDTWPTGDGLLNFPLLEDGLVRMVNAFEEFGMLLRMSPYLQTLEDTARRVSDNPDGTGTFRVVVSWKAAVPMARAMRDAGQNSARQILNQLQ